MLIFNEEERKRLPNTMRKTWEEFRHALAEKKFTYDDILSAKTELFLHVFDDLFSYTKWSVAKDVSDIHRENILCRAVKLLDDENYDYSRFIPDATKGSSNNRFSPKGIEWLYLATVGNENNETDGRFEKVEWGGIKEIKANKGERIALCKFNITRKYYKNCKRNYVVDLTVADDIPYEELEHNLQNSNGSRDEIGKFAAFIYMKLLSSEIFLPLSNIDDEDIVYAPFQCLAKYFENLNFCGIMYKSTVYEKSKNIVFFSKDKIAIPDGMINKSLL